MQITSPLYNKCDAEKDIFHKPTLKILNYTKDIHIERNNKEKITNDLIWKLQILSLKYINLFFNVNVN